MKYIVTLCMAVLLLTGCGQESTTQPAATQAEPETSENTSQKLIEITFDQFFTKSTTGDGQITDEMLALNGKKVGIKGYMTELTPIDNRFIYLVPTAGAACPFCSADNPKYLEAIAVYPPDGKTMEFTQDGIWAYGTLEVGEEIDEATGLISMFRLQADSIELFQPR
ncbi:hypothetical protein EJF36_18525 [Bacillus sp. HMF5848]|uniref:hypothetical protein n=1 Tax=Bacillus sp. HMF5848 TaxID=2495421 RepID=UPI000F791D68|nr:hypothetical protein [Bacillus sp. HMF5848]RSK28705.1 hypothetical protein EJF36_18525 [Bacillus sp. HMF5848]